MKKYYIFTFLISLGLSCMIYSCNKDDERPDDVKKDFVAAAVVHTEAMEACLDAIGTAHVADPSAILRVVEETAMRHVAESPYLIPNQDIGGKALKEELSRLYSFRKKISDDNYKGEYTYNDFLLYTLQHHQADLSEAQYGLLMSVNDVMETYSTADNIIPLLTEIKNVDCLALPEEERYVLYSVTTLAIESVNYWSENMDEWIDVLAGGDPDKAAHLHKWFNWGSIASSDIAGAIGGAIGGAITGSFAGGVGAGPGAIAGGAGGAVGVSAADAVMQVIDHYY